MVEITESRGKKMEETKQEQTQGKEKVRVNIDTVVPETREEFDALQKQLKAKFKAKLKGLARQVDENYKKSEYNLKMELGEFVNSIFDAEDKENEKKQKEQNPDYVPKTKSFKEKTAEYLERLKSRFTDTGEKTVSVPAELLAEIEQLKQENAELKKVLFDLTAPENQQNEEIDNFVNEFEESGTLDEPEFFNELELDEPEFFSKTYNVSSSKESIVRNWQKKHPKGTKKQCRIDTGLAYSTVCKWWK